MATVDLLTNCHLELLYPYHQIGVIRFVMSSKLIMNGPFTSSNYVTMWSTQLNFQLVKEVKILKE